MHTVKTDDTVNKNPNFLYPYKNRGMLKTSRNIDRLNGVISPSSIDVPEKPLSSRLTGDKNILMPMAFIIPAANKNIKFTISCFLFLIFMASPSK